jgi:hypothetical protein
VAHLWLVLAAGGVITWVELWRGHSRWVRLVLTLPVWGLVVWALAFGADFSRTYIESPEKLTLPEQELNGYFRNFTGFAIRPALYDVAQRPPLNEREPRRILGLTRACDFLPYHIPEDLPLEIACLERLTKFTDLQRILKEEGQIYVIWEVLDPPTRLADRRWIYARTIWLATYERPHDGIPVEVYLFIAQDPFIGGVRSGPET